MDSDNQRRHRKDWFWRLIIGMLIAMGITYVVFILMVLMSPGLLKSIIS
jgi:hypothetical protein